MSSEDLDKGEKRKVGSMEWKHSRVSDPDDIDALSNILSMEIERDLRQIEKSLEAYWKKRNFS